MRTLLLKHLPDRPVAELGMTMRLGIGLRLKIEDPAVGMTVYDVGDYVGQIGLRVDALELEGFDKRGDDRPNVRRRPASENA